MKDERVKHFLIMAGIVIAAAALAVYSWITLPAMVATQPAGFATGAPAMPKLVVVSLCTVLMVLFGHLGSKDQKMYWGSLIGVALHVLLWMCN